MYNLSKFVRLEYVIVWNKLVSFYLMNNLNMINEWDFICIII